MLTLRVLALAALAVGCTSASGSAPDTVTPPTRGSGYRPSQLRLTAVVVRLTVSPSAAVSEGERASLPGLYEGALVAGLNERALIVRDVGLSTKRELTMATTRAREVGADHAIVVDVRVEPDLVRVCEDTPRPLQGRAIVFAQEVTVVRASDGAVRTTLSVKVPALEVDCDTPRGSPRPRSATATLPSAVEALLARLLGP